MQTLPFYCMVELKIVLDDTGHSLFEAKLSQMYQRHLFLFSHAVQQKLLHTLQAFTHYEVVFDSVRLE